MSALRRQAPGVTLPDMTLGRLLVVLFSLMLGTLLAALDLSIVSTSLPTIAGRLNGFSGYAWVGTAYLLTSTVAMPILGKLSDLFGRQRLFHIAIVWFLVASVLCAGSQSMGQLIWARALQGVAGGGIQAITFAILGDLITARERGRYIGIYVGAHTLAGIGGPLVGGFIVDRWAWQWVFLINIPIGIVALVASATQLRVPFTRREVELDWFGAALLMCGLTCLLLGLEQGRKGWARSSVWVLLVNAVLVLIGFVRQERRATEPMIPLSLFRNLIASDVFVINLLVGAVAFGASNVFLPLFFQDARHVSPTRSGLYLVPLMLGSLIGTIVTGRLIVATGRYKVFMVAAPLIAASGVAGLVGIDADVSYTTLVGPLFLMGIGTGSVFTLSSVTLQNSVDRRDLGVATATLTFFRSLGGSIGLALFGTLFSARVSATVHDRVGEAVQVSKLIRDPDAILALPAPVRSAVVDGLAVGLRAVYLVIVPVLVLTFVAALLLKEIPLGGSSSAEPDLQELGEVGELGEVAEVGVSSASRTIDRSPTRSGGS